MNKVLVYTHSDCLKKNNGSNHPERSARLENVLNSIKEMENIKINIKESPLALINDISLVHPKYYINNIWRYVPTYIQMNIEGGK